jgi:hypothetical protein
MILTRQAMDGEINPHALHEKVASHSKASSGSVSTEAANPAARQLPLRPTSPTSHPTEELATTSA